MRKLLLTPLLTVVLVAITLAAVPAGADENRDDAGITKRSASSGAAARTMARIQAAAAAKGVKLSVLTTNFLCASLRRVAVSGEYEGWVRECVNVSDNGESARSYTGFECRQGGVRHTVCRVDLNDVHLFWFPPGSSISEKLRDDNFGIIPADGSWTAGFVRYGTWYNPSGTCFPAGSDWYAVATTLNKVRFRNGALVNFYQAAVSLVGPLFDC
jgi:hypothetical protein